MKKLTLLFIVSLLLNYSNALPSMSVNLNAIGKKACKLILKGCPDAIQPGLPETIQDCRFCCVTDTSRLDKVYKTKCKNRCLKACNKEAASLGLDPIAVSREQNK